VSAPPAREPWAALPLRDLLAVVASRSAPVAGGSAAAVVAAVAAALAERCAAEDGNESVRLRAEAARSTLLELVDVDAAALAALVRGLRGGGEPAPLAREASAAVAHLGGIARELAASAGELARTGKASLRGEARCAQLLAEAAAAAADAIVALNETLIPGDRAPSGESGTIAAIDLAHVGSGSGPRWGMQSDELNATLLAWPPGHQIAEHVNAERDVLMVVLDGSACVSVDDVDHQLAADHLLLIPRGAARRMSAGPGGVRYLSAHRRRGPLLPTGATR
jgi:mannose-6-phosphate isomerase-like protein (cupin superfamily)